MALCLSVVKLLQVVKTPWYYLAVHLGWWRQTTSVLEPHLLKDNIVYASKNFAKHELWNVSGNILAQALQGYTQLEVLYQSLHHWQHCRTTTKKTTNISFPTRPQPLRKAGWSEGLVKSEYWWANSAHRQMRKDETDEEGWINLMQSELFTSFIFKVQFFYVDEKLKKWWFQIFSAHLFPVSSRAWELLGCLSRNCLVLVQGSFVNEALVVSSVCVLMLFSHIISASSISVSHAMASESSAFSSLDMGKACSFAFALCEKPAPSSCSCGIWELILLPDL